MLKSKIFWLVLAALAALLVLWQTGLLPIGKAYRYQAVFLSNNQVYFGKLYNTRSDYPTLKDVYYLQVTQALQPRDPKTPAEPRINLVKLGGELHGPEDEMRINKVHILFIEDLKSDSQVVKAIQEFKTSQ